jgi:hypothetical protein
VTSPPSLVITPQASQVLISPDIEFLLIGSPGVEFILEEEKEGARGGARRGAAREG